MKNNDRNSQAGSIAGLRSWRAAHVRSLRREAGWLGPLCAVSLLAACASDKLIPATQLFVTIDSDIEVGSDLTRVHTDVLDKTGKQLAEHTFTVVKSKPAKNEQLMPFSFGVVKGTTSDVQLVVTGYGPDADAAVVERKLNVRFQDRQTLELTVFLSASCLGKLCDDESETCDDAAGKCAAIPDADIIVRWAGEAGKGGSNDAGKAGTNGRAGAGASTAGAGGKAGGSGAGASTAGIGGKAGGSGAGASAAGSAGLGGGSGAAAGSAGSAGAAGSGGNCAPSCAGKKCGPDGCNGTCGSCASNEQCTAGSCMCVPNCAGKRCGADGCGGSCGMCAGNDQCQGGTCVCTPNCTGKQCGPDGCGGQCGTGCNPAIYTCVSGQCKGVCDAVFKSCNCGIAPSQTEFSTRPEPLCADGLAVLRSCTDLFCTDPDTGFVTKQWGETCGCD